MHKAVDATVLCRYKTVSENRRSLGRDCFRSGVHFGHGFRSRAYLPALGVADPRGIADPRGPADPRHPGVDRDIDVDIDGVRRDVDVDVDVDGYGRHRDVDVDIDVDHHVRPGAVVAAVIAIGTRVHVLPTGCGKIIVGGVVYHSCSGVYYKPYYEGTTVIYIVVDGP